MQDIRISTLPFIREIHFAVGVCQAGGVLLCAISLVAEQDTFPEYSASRCRRKENNILLQASACGKGMVRSLAGFRQGMMGPGRKATGFIP